MGARGVHPQADLAAKIGTDAGQISRYENGHMTPSAEAVAKLTEVLDVSADYLLIDSSTRRSLRSPENVLGDHLALAPATSVLGALLGATPHYALKFSTFT